MENYVRKVKGQIINCAKCGKEFKKMSWNHKLCKACSDILKKISTINFFIPSPKEEIKKDSVLKNKISPDIYLVGYGRTMAYQIKCLKCGDISFPDKDNNAFCEDCLNLSSEKLNKYINPKKINSGYFADIVGWIVKKECASMKRSYYNFKKVLKRDNYTCRYCNYSPMNNPEFMALHVDHIMPFCAGGSNSMDNLVVACAKCNLFVSDKLFSTFLDKKNYILRNLYNRDIESTEKVEFIQKEKSFNYA